MWGGLGANFTNIVASVQKLSADLESQMDAAVGATPAVSISAAPEAEASPPPGPVSIDIPAIAVHLPDPQASFSPASAMSTPAAIYTVDSDALQPSVAVVGTPQPQKADKSKKKKAGGSKSAVKKKTAADAAPATPSTDGTSHADVVSETTDAPVELPTAEGQLAVEPSLEESVTASDTCEEAIPTATAGLPAVKDAIEVISPLKLDRPKTPECICEADLGDCRPAVDVEVTESLESWPATVETGHSAGDASKADADCAASVGAMLELEGKVLELENAYSTIQIICSGHVSRISELESKLLQSATDVESRDKIIESLNKQLARNDQECAAFSESLHARERSLESAMAQLAEVNSLLSTLSAKLEALQEENASMASTIKGYVASSGTESELRRKIAILVEECAEKDNRLQSYDQEGQLLAKKQGDMEKMVRKSKTELREKEAEIAKLKDGREQLVKTIEEMQEIIRRHDSDSTNTSKSISAMQAVSQASMDRLAKLEAELMTKSEEILNQKRALDAAWNESAELKRANAELRAERDDIKKNKDTRDEKIGEQESVMRDLEQREAVLRATNKQLQDSLQRQMADSSTREDRLREEIADARKRWHDAISNRESLAAEVGQSTAPLLRQISALHESLKSKSEAWQSVESALLERALRAESMCESATFKMKTLEEKYLIASKSAEELTIIVHDKDAKLQELQMTSDRWTRQEKEFSERVIDLESRLSAESTQRLNAQSAMREMESRMKSELRESKDAVEAVNKQNQLKISVLNTELDFLKEQLDSCKPTVAEQVSRSASKNVLKVKADIALNENASQAGVSSRSSPASLNNGYLPNGEISYVSANRINQQLEIKEQENYSLTLQLQQLQLSRSALLQEVSFLSARNAELEESLGNDTNASVTVARLDKENAVLLNLLGEKEEELENMVVDLKDVKNLYKSQLQELYDKIVPTTI